MHETDIEELGENESSNDCVGHFKYAIRITFIGAEDILPGVPSVAYWKAPHQAMKQIKKYPFAEGNEIPTLLASKEEAKRGAALIQERMNLIEEKERINDDMWKTVDEGVRFFQKRALREYFIRVVKFDRKRWNQEKAENKKLVDAAKRKRELRSKSAFEVQEHPLPPEVL